MPKPAPSSLTSSLALRNAFDPDLADLKPAASRQLENALKKFEAAEDCYPPRVTITVVMKKGGDPIFLQTIGNVRADALQQALVSFGLTQDQVRTDPVNIQGSREAVRVRFGDRFNDSDRDRPTLEVTSVPKDGQKVNAGDQIQIAIKASERYADGHKSWPTGVYVIQLISEDKDPQSKEYGRVPQGRGDVCIPRTEQMTYTVPSPPPLLVTLIVLAEDRAGNPPEAKVLRFPTGDWAGRLEGSIHQLLRNGPQDWNVRADLALKNDGRGGLTGALMGTQTQTLGLHDCHAVTTDKIQATLEGAFTHNAKGMSVTVKDRIGTSWPKTAQCKEGGSADAGPVAFNWPHFDDAFRGLTQTSSGVYEYNQAFTIPQPPDASFTVQYELRVWPTP
jgi:hypothetical protein